MADKDNIDKGLPNVDQEVILPKEDLVVTEEEKLSEVTPEGAEVIMDEEGGAEINLDPMTEQQAAGEHDANISFADTEALVGADLAQQVRNKSLEIYNYASKHASDRGIIIADTKFEFGLDSNNQLTLMDEALTPDSSRFWPLSDYLPGESPKSFDKQIIRDYLETLEWNKAPPAPIIPNEIMTKAAYKYQEIQTILCN